MSQMTGKISPPPLATTQTPTTRKNPPAPETAASKLVRKREPSMPVQRYLENSGSI